MLNKKYITIANISLICLFILTAGLGCKLANQETQQYLQPITLEYWRVWDDRDAFSEIIADYQSQHPNISIQYKKFRYEEYEQELLEAFAEDRGPDIFSIPESWLRKYQSKLTPMPEQITMAYQTVKGTIKKEVISELKTTKTLSNLALKRDFAETVYKDVVIQDQIYGLPLSLETLIMFYNKDILNRVGIIQTPSDWLTFQKNVIATTRFDSSGNILQSGTALGTGDNIERSVDILSIIMMQLMSQPGATELGASMTDKNDYVTFFGQDSNKRNRGLEAVNFYNDFANPIKEVYSWNGDMPNSLDSFLSGKVAFMFGYNYHLPTIKARAPRLNLNIAPIPQVSSDFPKNFANYWVETVSQKSNHQNEAWDFVLFATTRDNEVSKYLDKTQKPTARTSLINSQLENENLNAAASQILTSGSWYNGKNPLVAEEALKDMLDDLTNSTTKEEFSNILNIATQKINQTIR